MPTPHVLLVEDALAVDLAPLNLTRPTYELVCGGHSLIGLLAGRGIAPDVAPHAHLTAVARQRRRAVVEAGDFAEDIVDAPRLLINARLAPEPATLTRLLDAAAFAKNAVAAWDGETLAAAVIPATDGRSLVEQLRSRAIRWENLADDPCLGHAERIDLPGGLLRYPFDILSRHTTMLAAALAARVEADSTLIQRQDGLFVAEGAEVLPQVAVDSRGGPVVIDRGASVGPFTFFRGPVYVGSESTVNEHAALKDGVYVGRRCKVGGEIECAVISDFSNKQHFGFLGNAYIGSWVNLGAGTTNSDLKNTYGIVSVNVRGRKIASGLQFLGCMIGDYAKTAIQTAIYTGKTIGVASGVYGAAREDVPSFVNYPGSLAEATAIDPEIAITTMTRMYARRGRTPTAAEEQLMRDLFALTAGERPEMEMGLPR